MTRHHQAEGEALETVVGHANLWYRQRLQYLLEQGERVEARGRVRREVLHAVTTLPDPRKRVLTVPFRRANPFFQALEPLWILAGASEAEWICRYNSQLRQYLDRRGAVPDQDFHGAYGERLRRWGESNRLNVRPHHWLSAWGPVGRDQLRDVMQEIVSDPGSTRAAVVLRNPAWDTPGASLDVPCNISATFQLRQGLLAGAVFNRSNDLNLGLAYTNLVQFTTVQEFLAAGLAYLSPEHLTAIGPGRYTHFSSSLHVYEDDPVTARVLGGVCPPFDVYEYVAPCPMAPWESNEFIGALYLWCSQVDTLTQRAQDIATMPCPYWRSVAAMAVAWYHLKEDEAQPVDQRLAYALPYLVGMAAKDWQIAALEYVHRWAIRRGVRKTFVALLASLWGELAPAYRDPHAVRGFILHDDLEGGAGAE
jgi:thymidylate synthase